MEAALVTAASRFMVQKVADLLQLDQKLKAMTGTKRKMEKLKELSTIIDKVIQDIESRPFIDDAVKDLLKKLKYLAYDLEDVVDYYDTKVLQKKQRSESTSLRPVRDFFSSNNQVSFKSRVGGMIKAITESLDTILLQKSILLNLPQSSIRMSKPSLYRETHSTNTFVLIGRELEKNKIVNMLTKDDDDDNESNHGTVKVIAIVGMGGLGKTTLAHFVFNDERVKAHFENSRMWTVVGAEFYPAKIMKSILVLATGAPPVNISEIGLVKKMLEKALSGKRFLLVLDDVWNEDQSKWGILKAPLTFGARGSRILVTTRSQHVSSIMGSSNTTHQIQVLSENECLSLFKQFAFGDEEVDPSLMEIGGKIVKKCGGVPLAAISLGNMLHSTRDATFWSSVLKSEIWQLRDQQKQLFAILKLSYDSLPPRSKKCFAFASVFSKNYRMPKDELIKLWIANGFVHSEGNFDAETIGNRVFDELVNKYFFLSASIKYYYRDIFWASSNDLDFEDVYKMHDLMYDLARSVSGNVYWNSIQDSVEVIEKRTYHLQIDEEKLPNMTQVLVKKPLYLRTFMSKDIFSHLSINLLEVFSELKFLRVLDLTESGIREMPTSIGNLIHLRYLNLTGNNIEVLPDSITLLSNLQYLNLSSNMKLKELPKELGNMQNLKDLDFQRDFRLTHIPRGLSRLTNLRSLPLFIAGDKTGTCSIIELEDLKLRGEMKIKFSKDFKNYSCGGRKILKNKYVNELCIKFNGSERFDKDMLDDLCPNTSLKKLSIKDYESQQFSAWLMESQLPNLIEVRLKNCHGCKHIPSFGNLQFLKKLDLRSMNDITQMGDEFHGYRGFPSLQELFLHEMHNLEEWSEFQGVDELFPKLQSLQIFNCPKLKSMPRLPRIQHLEISYCNESILSCIGRLTSLSILKVDAINDMTCLPSGCIRNLTSLTKLKIAECRQLQSISGDEMQHLKMIHSLTINACPSIILQPKEFVQILNSVPKFQIQICDNKVNLRGQLQYLHTLKELYLCGVREHIIMYEIPKLSIYGCHELESLMTAESASSTVLEKLYIDGIPDLTTLPDWLQNLKSLRLLSVENCPLLETVPRGLQNLHMLEDLMIFDSPQLERRCEREIGEDWPIISHVRNVYIRSSY